MLFILFIDGPFQMLPHLAGLLPNTSYVFCVTRKVARGTHACRIADVVCVIGYINRLKLVCEHLTELDVV